MGVFFVSDNSFPNGRFCSNLPKCPFFFYLSVGTALPGSSNANLKRQNNQIAKNGGQYNV